MAFKFVVVLAFVSVGSAGYIQPQVYQAAPVAVAQRVLAKKVEEYDPHPQYKFAYDVQDSITGDVKSQSEVRDGDVVQGEYSLIDADGYKRIVQYTADAVHGFNAVVTRVPLNAVVKSPVGKTVASVAYAAPSYYNTPSVAYTGPAVVESVSPAEDANSAPSVLKTSAAVTYAAPSYYKSVPVAYAAPTYFKSAPVAYAAPTVVKGVSPVSYATSESYSAPAYVKSAPASYGYSH